MIPLCLIPNHLRIALASEDPTSTVTFKPDDLTGRMRRVITNKLARHGVTISREIAEDVAAHVVQILCLLERGGHGGAP